MDQHLIDVFKNFSPSKVISLEPFGWGKLNKTYKVFTEDSKSYIFQKINHELFNPVDKLMKNIELICDFVKKEAKSAGEDPNRVSLTIVKTQDNKTYYVNEDGTEYYRVFLNIENTKSIEVCENPKDFYNCALAYGKFNKYLAHFDATELYEILPNFHNTPMRYKALLKAIEEDKCDRVKGCKEEIQFFHERSSFYSVITDLLESGKMPTRVTHNDTKLSNALLDSETGEAVAVCDLDTIMPGSWCYDFGDSIRSGCKSGSSDSKDASVIFFRMDLFKSYVRGFMKSVGDSLTQVEKDNLVNASIVIALELAIRYLTDYLEGDKYFQHPDPLMNLYRCRVQMKLAADMEKMKGQMEEFVRNCNP